MAEQNQIARPYAQAAFEFARAANVLDTWAIALEKLAIAVQEQQVKTLLHDPRFDQSKLISALVDVCAEQDGNIKNFILLLSESHRMSVVSEIFELFNEYKAEYDNQLEVDVYSPFDMDGEQLQRLQAALVKKFGKPKVAIKNHIDKSLISGIRIQVGDIVIDNSVAGRVRRLRANLNLKGRVCQ